MMSENDYKMALHALWIVIGLLFWHPTYVDVFFHRNKKGMYKHPLDNSSFQSIRLTIVVFKEILEVKRPEKNDIIVHHQTADDLKEK